MGDYQYEWGTMYEYQKRGTVSCIKAERMTDEEMTYWQAHFYKKYDGKF